MTDEQIPPSQRALGTGAGAPKAAEPEIFDEVQSRLVDLLGHVDPVRMLDAGCGSGRMIPVADNCYVVGIDIEPGLLDRNRGLDEALVGDLNTYELPREDFDAVFCWDVLEHLTAPEHALLSFVSALKPGGVLILALSHIRSVKGLVTKYTPHWFHGFVWRSLLGAGREHEHFPTIMAPSIAPRRLTAFGLDHGMSIEYFAEFESWPQKKLRDRIRLRGRLFRLFTLMIHVVSIGTITASATDVMIVMRKIDP
jgi:SAM-dependent methyltransferase